MPTTQQYLAGFLSDVYPASLYPYRLFPDLCTSWPQNVTLSPIRTTWRGSCLGERSLVIAASHPASS